MSDVGEISAAFRLLGLARTATPAAIKKAHQTLRSKWHPDRPGGDKDMFALINEAHDIVSKAPPANGCERCDYTGQIRTPIARGLGETVKPCVCKAVK